MNRPDLTNTTDETDWEGWLDKAELEACRLYVAIDEGKVRLTAPEIMKVCKSAKEFLAVIHDVREAAAGSEYARAV